MRDHSNNFICYIYNRYQLYLIGVGGKKKKEHNRVNLKTEKLQGYLQDVLLPVARRTYS